MIRTEPDQQCIKSIATARVEGLELDFRGWGSRSYHESKGRKGRASRSPRPARAKERSAGQSRRLQVCPCGVKRIGPPGTKRSRTASQINQWLPSPELKPPE